MYLVRRINLYHHLENTGKKCEYAVPKEATIYEQYYI